MIVNEYILLVSVFFLFLGGCGSELSFSEIKLDSAKEDVRLFFKSVEDKNGTHLFFAGEKVVYVMLNGKNVIEGKQAIHFSDFSLDSDDETLHIHYFEEETADYSDETLKHQVIYKINTDKEYEKIRSFRNGNEATFEVLSGN